MPFPEQYRTVLLDTAWQSIEHGLANGSPLRVKPDEFDQPLREPGASFVTLHHQGELRGCIGSLEAYRPLINDVAENAFAAAFRDPRFPPLKAPELGDLTLDISLLSHPEAIPFDTEQDLLNEIRPNVDGLILRDGVHRGTFLPSVWESLPDRVQFLNQLKLKAGLTPDYWSDAVEVWRYTTESFGGTYG
jgi:AmmeMemoRadiSam system protein A